MSNVPPRSNTADDAADALAPTRASAAVPGSVTDPNGATLSDADPAPAARAPLPGRLGDYRILRKIGTGGMGTVYLAEDVRLGRKAAVKTMRPDLAADKENRSRFEREARAAAAVEHDNIVPIWCIGEGADGTPYIAMPFLQGEMLDDRLTREPVSPVWLIVEVGRDTADGLAAAHARGLIHRDIKPSNVWLEGDPAAPDPLKKVRRAKVLDFGLARSVSTDETQLTASGIVMGTPAYMSPEQARGADLDGRADLWSLGAMLYRMATGRQPFQGPTTMAVLCALIADTPPPVRAVNAAVPPALADLIDQLIQKDPDARPQTAEDVASRLRRIASTIDLVAAKLEPLAAVPPTDTGAWAGAGGAETASDGPSLRVVEPLAEELESRPTAAAAPHTPKPVRRALPPPQLPPRKVPLPVALVLLLLVGAAGVYALYPEVFGNRKPPDPAKKGGENPPTIKFQMPDDPNGPRAKGTE